MSAASRARCLGKLSRTVRHARKDVLPFAEHTGDRAYQFVDFKDGSRLEVRVWPDGRTVLTVIA